MGRDMKYVQEPMEYYLQDHGNFSLVGEKPEYLSLDKFTFIVQIKKKHWKNFRYWVIGKNCETKSTLDPVKASRFINTYDVKCTVQEWLKGNFIHFKIIECEVIEQIKFTGKETNYKVK